MQTEKRIASKDRMEYETDVLQEMEEGGVVTIKAGRLKRH